MYTCIHAYRHTNIHAYMDSCIHAYLQTCLHAYMYAHNATDDENALAQARAESSIYFESGRTLQHTATHCNTLQHTAAHCSTPIGTTSHKLERKAPSTPNQVELLKSRCITLQHAAAHWDTLQHTASHCNTLQHTH